MTNSIRIQLLGGLSVQQNAEIITRFDTHKIAALLAFLAYHRERAYSREVLSDMFWPDAGGSNHSLRNALYKLNQTLEKALVFEGSDVRINRDLVTTDVADFEMILKSVNGNRTPEQQMELLTQAIELYQGELLPGYNDDWLQPERARLARIYADALLQTAQLLRPTNTSRAIDFAQRAIPLDPLREDAYRILMRCYAASGRIPEVTRVFESLKLTLQERVGMPPSFPTRDLFQQLLDIQGKPVEPPRPDGKETLDVATPLKEPEIGELPGGAMPLDSLNYLVRPDDEKFVNAVVMGTSIVLVRGPSQVGKSSLLARAMQQARKAHSRVILTDFQSLNGSYFDSADRLLSHLAQTMLDELDLDVSLDDIWSPKRNAVTNFERFLTRHVLRDQEMRLVWGLDEVDSLFPYELASEFFAMLRSWHNKRASDPEGPWPRLTLAIAFATEARLFIPNLNLSPFNVGMKLELKDFSPGEVGQLNQRYGAPLSGQAEIAQFVSLLGGHPYLVSKGLYEMYQRGLDVVKLEAEADRDDGCFGDHLRRMLAKLQRNEEMCEAVRAVLIGEPCPSEKSFFKLQSAGVFRGTSRQDARLRCLIYQRYLERHLT